MNFFTSSFKHPLTASKKTSGRRSALYTLFLLACFLVLLETFTRVKLFPMSKDFVRFADYTSQAKRLNNQPGKRIAFIGNSLTQRGLDLPVLTREIERTGGPPVSADMFVADSSKVNTWYYMINRYFWKPGNTPDLLVVTYYEHNLEDGNAIEIGRLAQFFVQDDDWADVFQQDITDPTARLDFALSSRWATFAARDRIRERVLSLVTPAYKDVMSQVNDVNYQQVKKRPVASPLPAPPVTHRSLTRLLAAARRHHTLICFVAFPTQFPAGSDKPYPLNPETVRLIREAGMTFVDMRHMPELTLRLYADDIHLTPEGAVLYSQRFAHVLAPLLRKSQESIPGH